MISAAELRAKHLPPYQMNEIEKAVCAAASMGIDHIFGYNPHRLPSDIRLELEAAGYELITENNGSLTIFWGYGPAQRRWSAKFAGGVAERRAKERSR